MPDKKLSELAAAPSVAATDLLLIASGGVSYAATAAQLPLSSAARAALALKADASAVASALASSTALAGKLNAASNLADLPNTAAAVSNLGMGAYTGPQVSVAANRGHGFNLGRVQDAVGSGLTYLVALNLPNPVARPTFEVGNFWHNGEGDVSNSNDLPLKTSVSVTLNGPRYPVYWNRSATITVPGNQLQPQVYESDPLPINLPAGTVYVRTFVNPGLNGYVPVGTWVFGASLGNGEGRGSGDLTTSGAVGAYDGFAYAPLRVKGCALPAASVGAGYISRKAPSVTLCGDSIDIGFGQQEPGGWLALAAGSQCGFVNLAVAGERLSRFNGSSGVIAWARKLLLAGCTKVVVGYGTNDLSQGDTLANLQANLIDLANHATAQGVAVYARTLTPVSNSTDSWLTPGNQAVKGYEATRVAYNTWLRSVPPPLAGILDVAAALEVDAGGNAVPNGGFWRPPAAPSVYAAGTASAGTPQTLTDASANWAPNAFAGKVLSLGIAASGLNNAGCGIKSNTANTITAYQTIPVTPAAGTTYRVVNALTIDGLHMSNDGAAAAAAAVPPSFCTT